MSAWNVTSVTPVLVSGFEVCGEPHLHIPPMAEKRAAPRLCCSAWGSVLVVCVLVRKYFRYIFPLAGSFYT